MNQMNENELLVYVGSYAPSTSKGINVYRLNTDNGSLTLDQSLSGIENPSFLTLNHNQTRLYAVSEIGKADGTVTSYTVDPHGRLAFLNEQSSLGKASCYVTVDEDSSCLVLANYSSGSVALYPVNSDGSLGEAADKVQHEGSSIRTDRQETAHPHSAVIDPSGRYVFVPDLGLDQIKVYQLDYEQTRLLPHNEVLAEPGAGPRHLVFHPSISFAYVINELDCTITAYSHNTEDGALHHVQTVPALPKDFTDYNICADIHISPSGNYLYGSNRGHNSIVVYKIDKSTGMLTYVEHTSTQGQTPRNFAITPDGRFLLAANQDSDSIVTFAIDQQSGRLTETGQTVTVTKPVCVKIAKRHN
ncbi:lactonase family protein [Paenibacillus radicis (ex Xue et al. 2023)]|uniref:Lactonase family protein n=1 Tax=Paenibacillus radicis (ex Xue et al. 2023) TaxID=2972489 RepID=A0ABT1YU73_9BACL|nr:lactonase family protein [Paenibacillus radicis (ex Xue et al. 2023)]MCR8636738.1 lactonase family protein [Paenibacillus radicis (ex Xue et al. 2023)]